ncbi:hypothetical protein ONV78_22285 [Hahella sp. CR1]|uniref:hypothetical protein n=1 Tax=Hahella sp. CR1 TaxID=2992807 RepID=UPI002442C620|nr:hypothetical protein [Hahella sp. CR1]MDG9670484.1 hypothetical protein [Hahella sp. CR1]
MSHKDPQWPAIITKQEDPNVQRNVLIKKRNYDNWLRIKRQHPGNFYMTSMFRAIYALALTPGAQTGAMKQEDFGPIRVQYCIEPNGDVKVLWLCIDDSPQAVVDNTPGLYKVDWDVELKSWKSDNAPQSAMKLQHQWSGAHTAAVAGKFEGKDKAGETLFEHIAKAYSVALNPSTLEKPGNHYSLVWMNNDFNNQQYVKNIVSLIQDAQRQNGKVRWLVHGEGVGSFVKALETIQSNPLANNVIVAGNKLENQTVFFSNPRGRNTTEKALKDLCEKAGLHYAGVQVNSSDIFANKDARQAFIAEVQKVAAKGVVTGSLGAVGYTTLEKSFDLFAAADNIFAAIGIGLSGYVLAKEAASKLSGYARHVPGFVSTAFGKGNQEWKG